MRHDEFIYIYTHIWQYQPKQNMTSTENHNKPTNINEEEEAACHYAMELAHSSILFMVMKGAIELDLFEIIAKNSNMSALEIASHLPTQSPDAPFMLERMLHLLATYSLLTCTLRTLEDGKVEKMYGLAPAGKFYVRDGGSFAPLFLMQCERPLMEIMYHWKDAVLKGGCAWNETYKTTIGRYMETNPTFGNKFNTAMTEMVGVTMIKILDTYNGFQGLRSLVDIGGGNGTTLNMIISKYPSIKGINFDLPRVIKYAPSYQGIEQVGGDMFESIPKGEAILLKHVIHNWSDESCLKVLSNCYQVLPENGKVIIIESVFPIAPETDAAAKYVSLVDNLMVSAIEGKERTKQEFVALCKGAGFSKVHFVCCACTYWVMEAYK